MPIPRASVTAAHYVGAHIITVITCSPTQPEEVSLRSWEAAPPCV